MAELQELKFDAPELDFTPELKFDIPELNFEKSKLRKVQEGIARVTVPLANRLSGGAPFQPITETFGGPKPSEVVEKLPALKARPEHVVPGAIRTTVRGLTKTAADILTTPETYLIGPVLEGIAPVALANPVVRKFLTKNFPTLLKGPLAKTDPEWLRYQKWLGEHQATTPVQRVIEALKQAKPLRGKQEKIYSAARSKQAAVISEIGKETGGEAGFFRQLGALKGKLPKLEFEGIRKQVTQADIDDLFNMVERSELLPFDKISTKTALAELFGMGGGKVPTKSGISLLQQVFPDEFIQTVLSKRSLMQKVGTTLIDIKNIPKSIMASTDLSAPFRQGVFFIGRPKQFIPAGLKSVKYFFSKKAYQGLMKDIRTRSTYPLMRQGGLQFKDMGSALSGREELFQSTIAEKLPLIGPIIKASNRAFTGFLNKMAADVFDDVLRGAQKTGVPITSELLKSLGRFVSSGTGRGTIGVLEQSAVALNAVLWSPKLMMSRLNLLNPGFYVKLEPHVRKEALKSLLTFASTGASVLGLAKLGGLEVGVDWRSADFGKIKVGNTRYDIWGGFQQYIRLAGQLWSGEIVSSTTGTTMTLGEGYKPMNRADVLQRGAEMKLDPVVSFAVGLMRGKTLIGDEMNVPKELGLKFVPMVIQDMYDLQQEEPGLKGLGKAAPAIFGVGVQTYAPQPRNVIGAKNTVARQAKQLIKQGRIEEANTLREKFRDTTRIGQQLEPLQDQINKLTKRKEEIVGNTRIPQQQKTDMTVKLDGYIKSLEDKLAKRYKELK